MGYRTVRLIIHYQQGMSKETAMEYIPWGIPITIYPGNKIAVDCGEGEAELIKRRLTNVPGFTASIEVAGV